MKLMELGRKKLNSNVFRKNDGVRILKSQFAVCIKNEEYPVSLELQKIYQVIPDVYAEEHHLIRVVDESERIIYIPQIFLF